MGCLPPLLRRRAGGTRNLAVCGFATAVAVALTVSCSPVPAGGGSSPVPAGGGSSPSVPSSTAAAAAGPVLAELNQLRDNYSRQIIAIQLTNTTSAPVTVRGASVASPLFAGPIEWQAGPGGTELPPGQTKSLPAQLPAAECGPGNGTLTKSGGSTGGSPGGSMSGSPGGQLNDGPEPAGPVVALRLADAPDGASATAVHAADPYGVLGRNNVEMCLAQAAAAVAAFRLEPELEVSADGRSALMALTITPRSTPGTANPGSAGTLSINWIDRTTLLDEDQSAPWPRSVSVQAGGGGSQRYRLGIRPARCDAHAVAEDKVGTLLPLRVSAGGRDGLLKVDAGALLRGRIHDFVTAACGRQ